MAAPHSRDDYGNHDEAIDGQTGLETMGSRQAERLVRDYCRTSFRDDAVTDYMIADITTKFLL